MLIGFLVIAGAVALLLMLSIADLRTRRLPNYLVTCYVLLFFLYALFDGLNFGQVVSHVIVGVVGFTIFMFLLLLGAVGGGDVKLAGGVFLWAGAPSSLEVAVVVTWVGAGIAVFGWLLDRIVPRRAGLSLASVWYLFSARRGVPYGVALAAGGMLAVSRLV